MNKFIAIGMGAVGVVGAGVALYALSRSPKPEDKPAQESPFSKIGTNFTSSVFDANKDGRIDRAHESLNFGKDSYGSPLYNSIRAAADAADMVVGNRDGFATANEFAELAATYTTRPGATGLNSREASVFYADYRGGHGTGGTPDTIRGQWSD